MIAACTPGAKRNTLSHTPKNGVAATASTVVIPASTSAFQA